MPQVFEPVYLGLRKQVLEYRPTAPEVTAHRVWAALYEQGLDIGAVTLMCHRDGSCSMYTSSGGGMIGAQSVPTIAAASARVLDEFERDLGVIQLVDGIPPVPAPETLRFTAVTAEGLRSRVVDRERESPIGHPLTRLNSVCQDLVTAYRLHDEEMQRRGTPPPG